MFLKLGVCYFSCYEIWISYCLKTVTGSLKEWTYST